MSHYLVNILGGGAIFGDGEFTKNWGDIRQKLPNDLTIFDDILIQCFWHLTRHKVSSQYSVSINIQYQ